MACSESYPSMTYDQPKASISDLNKDELDQRTQVLLFVNPQDLFTVTTRSGMGSFPPSDPADFDKGTIYVYAFRDGKNDSGSELTDYADLTRSAYANINGTANDPDMGDCLVDGRDYRLGLPSHIEAGSAGELKYGEGYTGFGTKADYTCFYSNRYQETPYNFFAFYMDDLDGNRTAANAHRDVDSIWYDVEIDGRRDIMCGMAPPLSQIQPNGKTLLEDRYPTQLKGMSENDRNMIYNYGYSKFAADRNIHPAIDMKHQLTRLRFVIYPADPTSGDVVIQRITINNCRYKGKLTVATRQPELSKPKIVFGDDRKDTIEVYFEDKDMVDITDASGAVQRGFNVAYDEATMKGKQWYQRDSLGLGEGVILPTDSVFELTVHYKQRLSNVKDGPKMWTSQQIKSTKIIKLSSPTERMFKPGHSYNVKIAVYGRKELEFYTAFEDWKKGEDIYIDDEDEWKF
jgi:hypothetical protein